MSRVGIVGVYWDGVCGIESFHCTAPHRTVPPRPARCIPPHPALPRRTPTVSHDSIASCRALQMRDAERAAGAKLAQREASWRSDAAAKEAARAKEAEELAAEAKQALMAAGDKLQVVRLAADRTPKRTPTPTSTPSLHHPPMRPCLTVSNAYPNPCGTPTYG